MQRNHDERRALWGGAVKVLGEVLRDGTTWQLLAGEQPGQWEIWRSDPDDGWVCVEWAGSGDLREAAAVTAEFEALLEALGAGPGAKTACYSSAIVVDLADALDAGRPGVKEADVSPGAASKGPAGIRSRFAR